ncbi:MAG: hypothetical protein U1A78_38480 [Polyangia bacterium]
MDRDRRLTSGWRPAGLGLLGLGLAAACAPEARWQVAHEEDAAWLLAAAPGRGELLAVGGQPGSGPQRPGTGLVLVAAGGQVRRLDSPVPGMLWWVHMLPGGVAYLGGENGVVLRYDPARPSPLMVVPTDTTATLYGLWAFAEDDVWAVGGDDGQPGVVLHGGAGGLAQERGLPAAGVLYKIWAADRDRLFVVGATGVILRRGGGTWQRDQAPTTDRLLTVTGTGASEVYAVGGLAEARALRFDGSAWSLLPGTDPSGGTLEALAGVGVVGDELVAVGQRGLVARRRRADATGPWQVAAPVTALDLHATFAASGSEVAVGGNLSQFRVSPPRGVILQRGGTLRSFPEAPSP